MTEFEIASAIENYVTSHRGVTDFPLSIRQIRDEVDTTRLRFLDDTERADKGIVSLNPYTQTLTIETEKDKTGIFVEVPEMHYLQSGKLACLYIGSVTSKTPFKIVTSNRSLWAEYDMYSGKMPTAIYSSGIIRFKNVVPKEIFIEAVFKKPSELRPYGYDWKQTQYPAPYGIIDKIIGKTAESYLRTRQPAVPQPNTQSDIDTQGGQQLKQI